MPEILPPPTVVNIEDEMRKSYMDYAMSVIIGRAIPDVRDGLKPVHRRILYAMFREGLLSNRGYSKCAGVVGEVLKKYHPHGDSAVYDALVRLVQDFSVRYPLVDGQGNFGSVDGDPAAAYRYTEARLNRLAEEMLADIDKNTVDFLPNFDESTQEPTVLPSRIPNLLLNGSTGIAVGMATNIPPHNLSELVDALVALVDNPDMTVADLMKHVPGPDFPTGAYICGAEGIRQAYETGRGSDHAAGPHLDRACHGQGQDERRDHRDPLPAQQGAPHRADRRSGQRAADRGSLGHPRRVGSRRHARGRSSSSGARIPRWSRTSCSS